MAKNLEERVKELEKEVAQLKGKAALKIKKALGIGDAFNLLGLEWKILDITDKGYVCIAECLKNDYMFGSNNDWKESRIRSYLNGEFFENLAAEIGADNIIPFERDLFSLDGQTEYGTCEDKVSMLNVDEYRKYRALIPNADYYWWLLTAWSTPCNGYERLVSIVCPSGDFYGRLCNGYRGVRPFCILKSNIFVSKINVEKVKYRGQI